ncbi:MAG TPA: PKD domain-containing protein [Saprospiraceae bacterium]|nr:PKD domain-containing protein [Saprospiraceae bacterium]
MKTYEAPADVQFTNDSHKADRYEWDFGDGQTSTEEAPMHHYTKSGHYNVTLKAFKGKKVRTKKQIVIVKPPKDCLAEIQTPYGNMLVKLSDETPLHRDNFSKLAEENFYDSLLFHRVIRGFMIQGGDPNSKDPSLGAIGTGGPGYTIPAEFSPRYVHTKGAIAAARTGGPSNPEKRSSGSQFYIVQGKKVTNAILDRIEQMRGFTYSPDQRKDYLTKGGTPQLDMEYTVFGYVIKGLDVIDKIAEVKTNKRDQPEKDVWMKVILIN